MSTTAMARHQIKLSGDVGFQSCLKRARILLVTNGIGSGQLSEVAAFGLRNTAVENILDHLDDTCCLPTSPHARPPQKSLFEVTGSASCDLLTLKQDLAEKGATDCSLRSIVHAAICSLSEKNNYFIESIHPEDD